MYKPPPKDDRPTVWIPIASYEWAWGGTALGDASNVWELVGDYGGVTRAPAEMSEFPVWDKLSPGRFGFIGIQ